MRDDDFLRAEHSIFHPTVRRCDQDAELRMSFVVNHLRRTTPKPVAPVYATLMHKQIGKTAVYEKYLGIRPVFGSDVDALYYKPQEANLENPAADARLFSVANRHLEDLVSDLDP